MKPYADDQPKKEQIRTMFDRIAPTYDLLNRTLSLRIDTLWRRRVVRLAAEPTGEKGDGAEPQPVRKILDVATGTGDLALALARRCPEAEVTGLDLSAAMLAEARRKAEARGAGERVRFEEGDAEAMPFGEEVFDVVTVAFGVRNFGDLEAGLREMVRVLRTGGRIVVLELSNPDNPLFGALYRWYSHRLLPRIGGLVSRDRNAYRYLPGSVDEFPVPARFSELLAAAGLHDCRIRSQSGGIARIYTATKR